MEVIDVKAKQTDFYRGVVIQIIVKQCMCSPVGEDYDFYSTIISAH
jgi:hypothetical protein